MRRHLFVCTNARASGKPACGPRGGAALVAAVQRALVLAGSDARVTPCGCLGPCFDGPNAVVHGGAAPIWLAGLAPADAEALAAHLIDGRLDGLAARIAPEPGVDPDTD